MREALAARPDRDFVIAAPVRRPRGPAPVRESHARRLVNLALRYPMEAAITLALLSAGSVIAWNALALQTARHPAPLFGSRGVKPERPLPPSRPVATMPFPAPPPVSVPATAPAPAASAPITVPVPPRPAARDTIGDMIRTGDQATRPAPVAPPARPAPAASPAPERPASRDVIGDLIRLGEPAPIPPANVGRPEANRLVASGQRALAKLGYGVTADGLMGPSTQKAIEQFERERRIPVTGEFSPRTIREIEAQSGISVN